MENKRIYIMAQAWYGNRTGTEIRVSDVDRFIAGICDASIKETVRNDRIIVRVPETDNLVIIYSESAEERRLKDKEDYFKMDGYVLKPLAFIPEQGVEIYSRCIVCRMNDSGVLSSLEDEDFDKVDKYLAY